MGLARSRALTVCIAAIAECGRVIVMLADRALSWERDRDLVMKSESAITKIEEIRDGWWVYFPDGQTSQK